MGQDAVLLDVWDRIVSELAQFQDQASAVARGQVVNAISGSPCGQDTGCAAKVFAVEYARTAKPQWRDRAEAALTAMDQADPYGGLPEPVWDVLGWHDNPGSVYVTGTTLDAIWSARRILGCELGLEQGRRLMDYLWTCRVGPGLFAHDTIRPGVKMPPIQNIAAFALYMMTVIEQAPSAADRPILSDRDPAIRHLLAGQRRDGLWPYHTQGLAGRLGLRCPLLARFGRFNETWREADFMHHCLVLYYLGKTAAMRQHRRLVDGVRLGWSFVRENLEPVGQDELRCRWSWEKRPWGPRYCNYSDTNTYFLILACLPVMRELGIVDQLEADRVGQGVVNHISRALLNEEGRHPSIRPAEGPVETIRCILPMVEQSVAWKGSLLADWLEYNGGRLPGGLSASGG